MSENLSQSKEAAHEGRVDRPSIWSRRDVIAAAASAGGFLAAQAARAPAALAAPGDPLILGVTNNDAGTQPTWLTTNSNTTGLLVRQNGTTAVSAIEGHVFAPVSEIAGVIGGANGASGANWGVLGYNNSTSGTGVEGAAEARTGNTVGVKGRSNSTTGTGVVGDAGSTGPSRTFGVQGLSRSQSGVGVLGLALAATGDVPVYGAWAESRSHPLGRGLFGWARSSSGATIGVLGRSSSPDGVGVVAQNQGGGLAFRADGNAQVTGTLSKGGGSFKIDHPLDPEHKYLYHSFVESPDMKNVYDGVIELNEQGEATVELPDWFEALNSDFRYQLTAIGQSMPELYVKQEIKDNRFCIAGGAARGRVSWQATGIRQDPFARDHRIPVEEEKPEAERGSFLHPDGYRREPVIAGS